MLLGFSEDYTRIMLNVKQELILLRTSTDQNAMVLKESGATANGNLVLNKVHWKMPYVRVSNKYRVPLLEHIEEDRELVMPFRSWEFARVSRSANDKSTFMDFKDIVTAGKTSVRNTDISDGQKEQYSEKRVRI